MLGFLIVALLLGAAMIELAVYAVWWFIQACLWAWRTGRRLGRREPTYFERVGADLGITKAPGESDLDFADRVLDKIARPGR